MTAFDHILNDAQKELAHLQRELAGATPPVDWVSVARRCQELYDVAQRGMAHASRQRMAEINRFAMNGHAEPEPR